MTPTTIGPMIVLRISSIMDYLTSSRRRCRSAEQYYTIKEKLGKNSISGENEVNLSTIKRIVSGFQHWYYAFFDFKDFFLRLMIGFVSFLIFVEGYGIYLFFTESNLYVEDLSQNGLFGFTTFFIIFNLVLLALACWAGYKWKRGY